jgi:MSHA biogenesis protein MshL
VSSQAPAKASSGDNDLQRKVITNPQTGVAIVTAMPNELEAVRQFLDKTSLSVKRQVIIEAKILEIQLTGSRQTGINWNAINGQLLLGNNASSFDTGVNITEVSEGVGEVFSSLVRISDIGTLLSLLETQGEMQVLSSPRVSTVNNQKAVIRVGSDQFFVTGISSSTASNASSTTSSPDIELSSFFSGISLDVTPQISDEGGVILHIHPVISTVTEEQKNIVVGDAAFSLPLALRDIRESDSIVKAESGQVIVLGGLMQERISHLNGKRPGLADVPVAGKLFKTENSSRVKSELVILLRPIVVDQHSWVDDFNKSHQLFNHIRQTSSSK